MKDFIVIAILTGIMSSAFGAGDYTIMVPMRDEVRLATDIYLPDQDDGPWPLILIRTPNYKERYSVYGNYFSDHGYVVAIQDVRGQNESEGVFTLWMNDKEDGYDAVEWLAKYDPCNGIVGMFGGSYNGWATLAAATQKPPHLKCIAPVVSTGDPSIHHV